MRHTNSAPWGDDMGEMDSITSSGTRMTCTVSGKSASTPSDRKTVSNPGQYAAASFNSLMPSPTNRPVSSRYFLEDSSFRTI